MFGIDLAVSPARIVWRGSKVPSREMHKVIVIMRLSPSL